MPKPRLRKSLGQHHLLGPHLCQPLVDFLRPEGQRVLEIGPGGGVLSRALLAGGANLFACELDPSWAFHCQRELPSQIQLWIGDALEVDWSRVPRGWLVCGNLPYNVGTVIIGALLPFAERFTRVGFLLQLEVAGRLTASVGDKDYGALSVWTQAHVQPRILARVKPGSFRPPPKVDSAFVGWTPKPLPLLPREMEELREVVYAAFAKRRKTLRRSLASHWPVSQVDELLHTAGVEPRLRAEQLELSDYLCLHNSGRQLGLFLNKG